MLRLVQRLLRRGDGGPGGGDVGGRVGVLGLIQRLLRRRHRAASAGDVGGSVGLLGLLQRRLGLGDGCPLGVDVASFSRSWAEARLAWAWARLICRSGDCMVMRVCPVWTWSPTLTFTAVTVPEPGLVSVDIWDRPIVPLLVTAFWMVDTLAVAVA